MIHCWWFILQRSHTHQSLQHLLEEYCNYNFPHGDSVLRLYFLWFVYPMSFQYIESEVVEQVEEEGEDPVDGERSEEGKVFVRDSWNEFRSERVVEWIV